ncbi:hypothetical protein F5B20DRAFT_548095, partial [Whalleya microplaca]
MSVLGLIAGRWSTIHELRVFFFFFPFFAVVGSGTTQIKWNHPSLNSMQASFRMTNTFYLFSSSISSVPLYVSTYICIYVLVTN